MRITRWPLGAALLTLHATALTAVSAQPKMLVREPSHYRDYGYGYEDWDEFTGYFDTAFGTSNIVKTTSVGVGSLAGYQALMLTLPDLPTASYVLSAEERTEITAFLDAGGRMYVFGENSFFADWNNSIASLVGASIGSLYSGIATPLFTTGILEGVSEVNCNACGRFTNVAAGTSLFAPNVAALFGPQQNALFMLDVNMCDDDGMLVADNRRFCQNIAGYLAGTVDPVDPVQTTTPEPGTIALVATGLAGVAMRRRRRR